MEMMGRGVLGKGQLEQVTAGAGASDGREGAWGLQVGWGGHCPGVDVTARDRRSRPRAS